MGFLRLYSENFLALKYPMPDPEEQRAVLATVLQTCNETDEMEKTLRDSIRLLAERRTALITAAVTGKIALAVATVYPEAGERETLPLAAEGRAGYS